MLGPSKRIASSGLGSKMAISRFSPRHDHKIGLGIRSPTCNRFLSNIGYLTFLLAPVVEIQLLIRRTSYVLPFGGCHIATLSTRFLEEYDAKTMPGDRHVWVRLNLRITNRLLCVIRLRTGNRNIWLTGGAIGAA